jgi:hypothetical protein
MICGQIPSALNERSGNETIERLGPGFGCLLPLEHFWSTDHLLPNARNRNFTGHRRDCEIDVQDVGVVVLAVGCRERAEDLVLDESEVEVKDVDADRADFVLEDLPPQRRSEQSVQLELLVMPLGVCGTSS